MELNIYIRKYKSSEDYNKLLSLIKSEGEEWNDYLKPGYQQPLEESITYVALADHELCGYVRSISDGGLFIWVIDLLVHKNYRGNSIGRKLLETVKLEFPDLDVYVLSDVDEYYEKQGYEREGSIFKIL